MIPATTFSRSCMAPTARNAVERPMKLLIFTIAPTPPP
jgi:hypothetical protein